jgi:hypothetical protein
MFKHKRLSWLQQLVNLTTRNFKPLSAKILTIYLSPQTATGNLVIRQQTCDKTWKVVCCRTKHRTNLKSKSKPTEPLNTGSSFTSKTSPNRFCSQRSSPFTTRTRWPGATRVNWCPSRQPPSSRPTKQRRISTRPRSLGRTTQATDTTCAVEFTTRLWGGICDRVRPLWCPRRQRPRSRCTLSARLSLWTGNSPSRRIYTSSRTSCSRN